MIKYNRFYCYFLWAKLECLKIKWHQNKKKPFWNSLNMKFHHKQIYITPIDENSIHFYKHLDRIFLRIILTTLFCDWMSSCPVAWFWLLTDQFFFYLKQREGCNEFIHWPYSISGTCNIKFFICSKHMLDFNRMNNFIPKCGNNQH